VRIALNGESTDVFAQDIDELLTELALPKPTMLVEHNGLALRREEWADRTLAEGDRVEIIRIVAGG
jgi:sulfur carrier protein